MKILGTGLNGLVGSRIVDLLKNKYEFENVSRSTGVDIQNKESVLEKIKTSDAKIVLHLAAKTDVDGCEKDKALGQNGEAWMVNVNGTKNIADACFQSNKKLVYISTDFVFDGENAPADGYSEDDNRNPINWYGQTKCEGEKIVENLQTPWMIVRIAYPYRADFAKSDFFRTLLKRLQEGKNIAAVTDSIFTPTFIDDIAHALDALIENDSQKIFHVVGDQGVTVYDATLLIAEAFSLNKDLITKTTRKEFFKDRAPRPFQLHLKNDKIEKLGIKMHSFEEGIREIKSQINL